MTKRKLFLDHKMLSTHIDLSNPFHELYLGNVRKMHNGRNDDMSEHFSRMLHNSHAKKCKDFI